MVIVILEDCIQLPCGLEGSGRQEVSVVTGAECMSF